MATVRRWYRPSVRRHYSERNSGRMPWRQFHVLDLAARHSSVTVYVSSRRWHVAAVASSWVVHCERWGRLFYRGDNCITTPEPRESRRAPLSIGSRLGTGRIDTDHTGSGSAANDSSSNNNSEPATWGVSALQAASADIWLNLAFIGTDPTDRPGSLHSLTCAAFHRRISLINVN